MFYADVPNHTWRLFGSQAKGTADRKSDLDIMLCGIQEEDLNHPYFQDVTTTLRRWSVEEGGALDLFLDQPKRGRLQSIFSPKDRAIDAGPEVYAQTKRDSREIPVTQVYLAARHAAWVGRDPVTSLQEAIERAQRKTS